MKVAVVIFGVLAAATAGLAALFKVGELFAVLILVLILGAAIYALFANRNVLRGILIGVVIVFFASSAFVGLGILELVQALTGTDGPVDAPDLAALASADAKVDEIKDSAAFRLELTEDEMTAYVLDGLQGETDNPLRSVSLDVVDGASGEAGSLRFDAEFKSGGVGASGAISVTLEMGAVQVDLADLSIGAFAMPGIAENALEDLIERIADFNTTLAKANADVQAVTIGNDRIVIVGTQLGTDLLTSQTLLTGLQQAAASAVNALDPPPERLGPGRINSTSEGIGPFYVALGDSLAANVGVAQARDGYVSRFHLALETRDARNYGLRNFGISGETTGTLIRAGQLDEALAFLDDNDVAYVSIDVGANNLLGHLGSEACSETLSVPDCQSRLTSAFDGYGADIEFIFDEISSAAPDATVIFMVAYNPFSLGLGTELETTTDSTLDDFNQIAVRIAVEKGILVADAFTPMMRTTGSTTHMLDAPPDIHPVPIGFDILAAALLDSLG